ncbi:MAG: hypothetical protein ACLP0J_10395 [Solirubrobacteraceae bacterium]
MDDESVHELNFHQHFPLAPLGDDPLPPRAADTGASPARHELRQDRAVSRVPCAVDGILAAVRAVAFLPLTAGGFGTADTGSVSDRVATASLPRDRCRR